MGATESGARSGDGAYPPIRGVADRRARRRVATTSRVCGYRNQSSSVRRVSHVPLDLLHCGDPRRIGAYLVETEDGLGLQVVIGHPLLDSAEAERLLLAFALRAVGAGDTVGA